VIPGRCACAACPGRRDRAATKDFPGFLARKEVLDCPARRAESELREKTVNRDYLEDPAARCVLLSLFLAVIVITEFITCLHDALALAFRK